MKLFDCFIFRDEFKMLELRVRYLAPYVDTFVIITGSHTFQGEPLGNPEHVLPDSLLPYRDKLQFFHTQMQASSSSDSWALEEQQRNASIEAVSQLTPDEHDLILISDVDEIWFCSVAEILKNYYTKHPAPAKYLLPMWDSYFYADVVQESPWRRVFVMPWSLFKTCNPFKERTTDSLEVIGGNCGWHMTYSGGVENIQRKQETFAHTEFRNTKYVSKSWLAHCVEHFIDPYEREITWSQLPVSKLRASMEPTLLQLLANDYPELLSRRDNIAELLA